MRKRYQNNRWKPHSQRKESQVKVPILKRCVENFSIFRKLISEVALLFLAVFALVILFFSITKTEIILDPIEVPTSMLKFGYTGTVVAEKVLEEARKIGLETQRLSKKNISHMKLLEYGRLSVESSAPDIKIPSVDLTMRSIIRYLQQVIGTSATYLRGNLVQKDNGFILTLRNITEKNIPAKQIVTRGELDQLIQKKGGEALLQVAKPSVLAINSYYKFINKKSTTGQDSVLYQHLLMNIKYCLKYSPSQDDALVLTLWGNALGKLEHYDEEAIEKYRQAIKIDPEYVAAYGNWGNLLAEREDYNGAIKKYRQISKIDPEIANIFYNWGTVLSRCERYVEASEKFRQAIKIDTKHASAYLNLGVVLYKLTHYDEAIEKFRQAIKIDLKFADAYVNWGIMLVEREDYDEAIEKYRYAIKIDPELALAYHSWGNALFEREDYDEAIEKYRQAIKIDPEFASAYYNWGIVLDDLKHYDEAMEKYSQAIKIDPKHANAYHNWGIVLSKLKRNDEATEKYRKARELAPELCPEQSKGATRKTEP